MKVQSIDESLGVTHARAMTTSGETHLCTPSHLTTRKTTGLFTCQSDKPTCDTATQVEKSTNFENLIYDKWLGEGAVDRATERVDIVGPGGAIK